MPTAHQAAISAIRRQTGSTVNDAGDTLGKLLEPILRMTIVR